MMSTSGAVLSGGPGAETLTGGAGSDTVSYAASVRRVHVDLAGGFGNIIPRVMPLGDSITFGMVSYWDLESGGYRTALWEITQAAGTPIDFVGTKSTGPETLADRDHNGFPGERIQSINFRDEALLREDNPDVVLLMIGTNDTADSNLESMKADLRALLSSLTSNSGARVLVSSIPPTRDPERNKLVDAYNAAIPGLIAELGLGTRVTFVSMNNLTVEDISPLTVDNGLHPTRAGYEKIAANWHAALTASGVFAAERDTLVSIENVAGSRFDDLIYGDSGANALQGLSGNDLLDGRGGNDQLYGGDGADTLIGGDGNDTLVGEAGADVLIGGGGDDVYRVDHPLDVVIESGVGTDTVITTVSYALAASAPVEVLRTANPAGTGRIDLVGSSTANLIQGNAGANVLDGRGGADRLQGFGGNDTYYVDNSRDTVLEKAGGGTDTVLARRSYALSGSTSVEVLRAVDPAATTALNLTGNAIANRVYGNEGANRLSGGDGSDKLYGLGGGDVLIGGAGNDRLTGGFGRDVMTGGPGRDLFVFDDGHTKASRTSADMITDFDGAEGDRLDLRLVDAKRAASGDQAFTFIGTAAFTKAGQVRYVKTATDTWVYLNTDSDSRAEATIRLKGSMDLLKEWFLL